MLSAAALITSSGAAVGFECCRDKPRTQRLAEHEHIAGAGFLIRNQLIGGHDAGCRQPVLNFHIAHRMASRDYRAGLLHAVSPSAQDVAENAQFELVIGKAHDVQGGNRPATHGVNVAQRIGSSDLAEDIGIVHERRKEIQRLHDHEILAKAIDARVAESFGADDQIGIIELWQPTHDLRGPLLGQLARSSSTAGVVDQPFLPAPKCHRCVFQSVSISQ